MSDEEETMADRVRAALVGLAEAGAGVGGTILDVSRYQAIMESFANRTIAPMYTTTEVTQALAVQGHEGSEHIDEWVLREDGTPLGVVLGHYDPNSYALEGSYALRHMPDLAGGTFTLEATEGEPIRAAFEGVSPLRDGVSLAEAARLSERALEAEARLKQEEMWR
jgi:hypothetical protein